MHLYHDRNEAGEKLAEILKTKKINSNAIILALPCGGVPVAAVISKKLNLPFDVLVVRQLEIGAMTEDENFLIEGINEVDDIWEVIREETRELRRRIMIYRKGRALPDLEGREVILVDDGLTTGITARAAARFIKKQGASRIILAIPAGEPDENEKLMQYIDDVVCPFKQSEIWFEDFTRVSDSQVLHLLVERGI